MACVEIQLMREAIFLGAEHGYSSKLKEIAGILLGGFVGGGGGVSSLK